MAVMLSLSLVISNQEVSVAAAQETSQAQILETDVAAPYSDCSMLLVYGSYYSQAQEALDRINEIRKEACEAGNVPDPRDDSQMLSASDYVPIKWSRDLESIARIRAMESSMTIAHKRLNGRYIFDVSYNGVTSSGEVLAWNNRKTMVSGIEQWYAEKSYWVNSVSGKVTGHYTAMINPSYTYVGLGEFYSDEMQFSNTVAGEFSGRSNLDETMQGASENVMQKVEVANSLIDDYVLDGMDTIYTEQEADLTPKGKVSYGSTVYRLGVLGDITYSSSAPSVARIDQNGVVTGIKSGTAVITATRDGSVLATLTMTIKCNHEKELISYTAPSCTSTGKKVYRCEQCGEDVTEIVAKVPHDYVYSEADSDGKKTGVCSMCGDTIRITPPTSYTLYWRNGTSADSSYWSYFPRENPIGSILYLWPENVNGEAGYQELVAESSDESVIKAPEQITNGNPYNTFKILTAGITTITVYPKYNASVKRTYVVRVGDTGSVSITPAEVTLSKTSYEYNNKACTPEVSVVYHDTKLTKGTDYTVTYENNDQVGSATAVITGAGIFTGTIRKSFTITGNGKTDTSEETTTTRQPATSEEANTPQDPGPFEPDTTKTTAAPETTTQANGINQISEEVDDSDDADDEEELSKEDDDDTLVYPKAGSRVTIKGIKYKVTYVSRKNEDYKVVCVGTTSKKITKAVIPNYVSDVDFDYEVVGIAQNAFSGCKKLRSVTISDFVTSIDAKAFYGCSALKTVTIPEEVKKIGAKAFAKCKALRFVKIESKKLTQKGIGSKAFSGIHKHATGKVPASKKSAYKKWLKKAGLKVN